MGCAAMMGLKPPSAQSSYCCCTMVTCTITRAITWCHNTRDKKQTSSWL